MHVDELSLEFEFEQAWDDLESNDGASRHCHACEREVVNLSAMTEAEARELLSQPDPPCAAAAVHPETGRVLFSNSEQLRAQRSGLKHLVAAGTVSLLMTATQNVPGTFLHRGIFWVWCLTIPTIESPSNVAVANRRGYHQCSRFFRLIEARQ